MRFNFLIFFLLIHFGIFSQDIFEKIEIKKVSNGVYKHTTYGNVGGTIYPANGIFIIGEENAILIDTPWNKSQTEKLLEKIERDFGKKVRQFIPTHHHQDQLGGIQAILEKNIPVIMSKKTYSLAKEKYDLSKVKKQRIRKKMKVSVDDISLQIYYPGHGHTIDNLIVYLPKERVLFGGCFVKSAKAKHMGYIKEADLKKWKKSLKDIQKDFKHAQYVVPGHGKTGDMKLIPHTIDLIEKEMFK